MVASYSKIFKSIGENSLSNKAESFILNGESLIHEISEEMSKDGIIVDFTVLSVPMVLQWMLSKAKATHEKNMDVFGKSSGYSDNVRSYLSLSAYYLGESFVRTSDSLCWKIKEDTPIVSGFKFGFTMSPADEVNTVFKCILKTSEHEEETNPASIASIFKTTLKKLMPKENNGMESIDQLLVNWLVKI